MKEIKVLETGCVKFTKTIDVISTIANELNIDVHVVKENDLEVIMGYSVMSTPTVIIDEINVHSGSIPSRQDIELWLQK
jgi:hypothetical protein